MDISKITEALRLQSTQAIIASELGRRSPRQWVIERAINDLEENATKGVTKSNNAETFAVLGEVVKKAIADGLKGAK